MATAMPAAGGLGSLPWVCGPPVTAPRGVATMARTYAGVLGLLGWAVALLRGALVGAGLEGTITSAIASMIALAAVGGVVGAIAEATVDEAVRTRLQSQLAELGDAEG